jgi:hypothetical protein
LRDFVTDTGMVHYPKLVEHSADLDRYIAVLGTLDFTALGRNEKLALLINSYNAFTLRLIIDHWPVHSIQDIPAAERWDARRWRIGDLQLSLDEIEHDYLRKRFREPRIHFAINCASIGCPPLRVEPYRAERLERQLQEQAERMHRDPTWVELRDNRSTIRLTRLYQWFSGDFEQVSGSVLDFAARFLPDLAIEVEAGRRPTIEWIEYDWGINLAR